MSMKYLSLFSGIGGFEHGITSLFPNAECVGFAEIDKHAICVYKSVYPAHHNLGDVTKITKEQIPFCDLIVGGFPCTNLSSMANFRGNNAGLQGPQSSLFFHLVRIITFAREINPHLRFIIENNQSMTVKNLEKITSYLQEQFPNIVLTKIDNGQLALQNRKRLIWTNFPVKITIPEYIQTWKDVLESDDATNPYILSDKMISCLNKLVESKTIKKTDKTRQTRIITKEGDQYNFEQITVPINQKSRWDLHRRSDTAEDKARPIVAGMGGGNNILIVRKSTTDIDKNIVVRKSTTDIDKNIVVRKFTPIEIERLFGFPDGYTKEAKSNTRRIRLLGNSIPVFIVKNVLNNLL